MTGRQNSVFLQWFYTLKAIYFRSHMTKRFQVGWILKGYKDLILSKHKCSYLQIWKINYVLSMTRHWKYVCQFVNTTLQSRSSVKHCISEANTSLWYFLSRCLKISHSITHDKFPLDTMRVRQKNKQKEKLQLIKTFLELALNLKRADIQSVSTSKNSSN